MRQRQEYRVRDRYDSYTALCDTRLVEVIHAKCNGGNHTQ
jgi:hypothetical protein